MAIKVQPEKIYLSWFKELIQENLLAVLDGSEAFLSDRAKDRLEVSFWREVLRIANPMLEKERNDRIAETIPFALVDPKLYTKEQKTEASAKLLARMETGEYRLPEALLESLQKRLRMLADAEGEMVRNLLEHKKAISDVLFCGEPYRTITEIQPGAGDYHNGARAVAIVETDRGKLIYKPRSGYTDVQALKFVRKYISDQLIIPRCFDGGSWSVCQYLEKQKAEDSDGASAWYRAMGEATVLFEVLGSTDMTVENIMAADGLPALIDLETLLAPGTHRDLPGDGKTLAEYLSDTMWNACLLPRLNKEFQLSVLFDEDTTRSSMPRVNDVPVPLAECIEDYKEGFRSAYARCLANRDELQKDIRNLFSDSSVRIVMRDTQSYGTLMDTCSAQRFRGPEEEFRAELEQVLSRSAGVLNEAACKAEADILLTWDIPLFEVRGNSKALTAGNRVISEDLLTMTPTEHAEQRVLRMSAEKGEFLLEALCRGFSCRKGEGPEPALPKRSAEPLAKVTAVSEAEAILAEVEAAMITAPGGAEGWILFDAAIDGPAVSQYGMVYGTTGVGLFAAAVKRVTQRAEIKKAAEHCMHAALADVSSLLDYLETEAGINQVADAGEAAGFGGILRCLILMNRYEPGISTDLIRRSLDYLSKTDLSLIKKADRLSGLAGLLGTMCRYQELYEAPQGPDIIRACAERLIELKTFEADGFRLWNTVSERHMISGAGHGMAGIAEALYAAGNLSDEQEWIMAAQEAMEYEANVYDAEKGTWPDNRALPRRSNMHGYCSGAPGIGIMAGRMNRQEDSMIRQNAMIAAEKFSLLRFDHLCCGNAAIAEAELSAGLTRRAGTILGGMKEQKDQTGSYRTRHLAKEPGQVIGLFFGLSGIGYELLRYAEPDVIESVL